jgi:UrcA family protein
MRRHLRRGVSRGRGRRYLAMLLATVSFASGAVQAGLNAGEEQVVSQISLRVPVNDLDLGTEHGRQLASQRVQAAARRLCNRLAEPEDLDRSEAWVRCVQQAVGQAQARTERAASAKVASTSK